MERAAVDLFLSGYERLYQITCDLEMQGGEAADDEARTEADQDDIKVLAGGTALRIKRVFEELFSHSADVAPALREELRYALAALVDEMLIHQLEWAGKDIWFDYLIEEQQYQTSIAGRRLFRQINSLQTRFTNPVYLDQLATVYLMLLQLGFCGELRYQPDRLAEYRHQLNQLRLDAQLPEQACAQAYNFNLVGKEAQKLAAMRSWWRKMALGVGGFLLVALAVWMLTGLELNRVLKAQMQSAASTSPVSSPAAPQPAPQPPPQPASQFKPVLKDVGP